MKSELSFLMDLFLNDDVQAPIKKLVADRIREVESALNCAPQQAAGIVRSAAAPTSLQSPSMQRIMAAHPDVPINAVEPSTPAAAAALQQRAAIINARGNEKPEAGRSNPRKF